MNRQIFFTKIRAGLFKGSLTQHQTDGMTAILEAWGASGFTDSRWLAYCLATTYHETATTMWPIEEYGKGKSHAYGVPTGPWHQVYDGRGDVQLTWLANYTKATTKLRAHGIVVDLVQHPEQALVPTTAAVILIYGMAEGWFTGFPLAHYFNDLLTDPINARRVINGTDRAAMVASYYSAFLACIIAAKDAQAKAEPVPAPVAAKSEAQATVITPAPKTAPAASQGFWAWLFSLFTHRGA